MLTKLLKATAYLTICLLSLNANAWTIQQDYDAQSLGDTCDSWQDTESIVTNIAAFSGSQSCLNRVNIGDTAFGYWGGTINFPSNLVKGDEIWIRLHTFMPTGFDYNSSAEGNLLKFLRVHTRDATNTNIGYNDWYITPTDNSFASHQFIYEGEQVWSYVTDLSLRPVLNTWETYEIYLKLDNVPAASGGQARVRFWKNGILILDAADRQTLQTAVAFAERMHIFTYWNGGSPQTQQMYIDDLIITSTTPTNTDASGNPFIGASGPFIPNNSPTAPVLTSPADGATGIDPNSASLEWNPSVDVENDSLSYQVTVCEDNTFVSCTPTTVVTAAVNLLLPGIGLGGAVLLFGFIGAPKRVHWQNIITLITLGLIISACDSDTVDTTSNTGDSDDTVSLPSSSCTATGPCFIDIITLNANTTYYWKVTADDGFSSTDSATWSFVTN